MLPKIRFTKIFQRSARVLKRYKDFPLYRAPEVLISSISFNVPILFLASIINPAAAGFYGISRTALGLPAQLIGTAIGDVFYPRIANAFHKKESLTALIRKATIILFLLGLLPFGIIIIMGPFIFSLVFGDQWTRAGEYAQWMSIMSLTTFISRPAVQALAVINAQRFHLIFTIVMTILRISSLYFGLIILKNDLLGVILFCIVSSIMYVLLIILTLYKSGKFMKINY